MSRKAAIALYRKFFLDFVVFGFDADKVEEIIDSATGTTFDHSKDEQVQAILKGEMRRMRETDSVTQYANCNNFNRALPKSLLEKLVSSGSNSTVDSV